MLIVLMARGWPAAAAAADYSAEKPAAQEGGAVSEKPLEAAPQIPQFIPSITPYVPYLPYFPYSRVQPGSLTGILAPYGSAYAQDTLRRGWQMHRLGPLEVSPSLEYDAMYRTNVFETATDKKSDFINIINPGIQFQLPFAGQNRLSLGYLGNYFIYSRFSSQDHYDHYFNADAALNFSRLNLRFGSGFRAGTEEENSEILRNRNYYAVSPYFQAGYGLADRWWIETNYQLDTLSFASKIDRLDNYQDQIFGASLFYKFWPKTSVFLQYVGGFRTHPFNSLQDNTVQSPYLGLNWAPTAKISGSIKIGYSFTNYDHQVPGLNSSTRTWSFNAQTSYRYNNYTTFILLAQRSIQEDVDLANTGFIGSGLTATVNHYFHYFKVSSYLTFSYYNNSYVNGSFNSSIGALERRNDNYLVVGGGLNRPLGPWLRVRLDYIYTDKSSNFGGFSYNEHRVLVGLQTAF